MYADISLILPIIITINTTASTAAGAASGSFIADFLTIPGSDIEYFTVCIVSNKSFAVIQSASLSSIRDTIFSESLYFLLPSEKINSLYFIHCSKNGVDIFLNPVNTSVFSDIISINV